MSAAAPAPAHRVALVAPASAAPVTRIVQMPWGPVELVIPCPDRAARAIIALAETVSRTDPSSTMNVKVAEFAHTKKRPA